MTTRERHWFIRYKGSNEVVRGSFARKQDAELALRSDYRFRQSEYEIVQLDTDPRFASVEHCGVCK